MNGIHRSLIPQLVEVTDVGDAADTQVPSHVGRHGQQAVPVQLTVLHLKRKETRPFFTTRKVGTLRSSFLTTCILTFGSKHWTHTAFIFFGHPANLLLRRTNALDRKN